MGGVALTVANKAFWLLTVKFQVSSRLTVMKKSPLDDLKFSVSSGVVGGRFVFPHSFYNKQNFAYTLKSLVSYTKSGNLDFTSVMNLLITDCF